MTQSILGNNDGIKTTCFKISSTTTITWKKREREKCYMNIKVKIRPRYLHIYTRYVNIKLFNLQNLIKKKSESKLKRKQEVFYYIKTKDEYELNTRFI